MMMMMMMMIGQRRSTKLTVHCASYVFLRSHFPALRTTRKFFNSVEEPRSCLHHLLPPPRDPALLAHL